VDALRGFGITSENVSLLKNTSFGHEGRYKLQFRVEFYNLFNRHTFANPITDLTSPSSVCARREFDAAQRPVRRRFEF